MALGNLGLIALDRGDLDSAETLTQRTLALEEELGSRTNISLSNLGEIAHKRGHLREATAFYRRALDECQDAGPGGYQASIALKGLADVAAEPGPA